MNQKRFRVEKLIRDKLPEILRANGVVVNTQTINKDEYLIHLKDKLIEEATEVCEAETRSDTTEELADLLEVIHTLANINNISVEEIEIARLNKKALKGGFEMMTYNTDVEIDSESKFIKYYTKYPEIIDEQHKTL